MAPLYTLSGQVQASQRRRAPLAVQAPYVPDDPLEARSLLYGVRPLSNLPDLILNVHCIGADAIVIGMTAATSIMHVRVRIHPTIMALPRKPSLRTQCTVLPCWRMVKQ